LQENAVKKIGKPERVVITTCGDCGVGCTFRAELRGEQLVRMVPWNDGKANCRRAASPGAMPTTRTASRSR